ncbi:AraC family transcriptional regulator [Kosakonia radicincitans DSM 16656]|uniref:Transcriptional regulator GlxA family, contains an amidase domain and an AraC-type DNA-binding HTH domain n=1 Tax=Kosakonia radicincitans TaxID=283686 RepID=A0AAX2EL34_9ENTR|nr:MULTISPECIES: GlxA family transcriptional regulator [Kosakonia]MDP9565236.1 transcriptional regulator GlxA family with amidase domain [Kosakonia oryzae]APG16750.1 AraC family transcriptional regulator [Kosakonia radicincitans]ARD62278.1 AraC family transcriptional regulator [Kosakonia radicincitans DSM 16656]KDE35938.1 AraC family transcriptional regulator [Kosakonia radicincitans UMEnt01/12]MDD7993966.1 GlxA family transcriptional regulator [Kosakonia radicincitans]
MHKIGLIIADHFQMLAISTLTVFEFANMATGKAFYQPVVYSEFGGTVRSSSGIGVDSLPLSDDTQVDSWLVAGVLTPVEEPASAGIVHFLQTTALQARRIAGVCTGAFVLAQAGLLDKKRATTHWAHARSLLQLHPDIQLEDDRIFIIDDRVWTSAGMTAGLDMALGMVEKDLGAEIARAVAHNLVMNQRRSGGQTQHSEMLALAPRSDRLQSALEYARSNLSKALTVELLADAVHLSARQLSRLFRQETGKSPAKAIEGLRLEAARLMIEQSRLSLDAIARESGFRDRRHMREVFIRGYGIPPQSLRTGR